MDDLVAEQEDRGPSRVEPPDLRSIGVNVGSWRPTPLDRNFLRS